jgi:hypothetical protein
MVKAIYFKKINKSETGYRTNADGLNKFLNDDTSSKQVDIQTQANGTVPQRRWQLNWGQFTDDGIPQVEVNCKQQVLAGIDIALVIYDDADEKPVLAAARFSRLQTPQPGYQFSYRAFFESAKMNELRATHHNLRLGIMTAQTVTELLPKKEAAKA